MTCALQLCVVPYYLVANIWEQKKQVFQPAVAIWRPLVYKMDTVVFLVSVGLTYEQSAVKLGVRVLKCGTVLYKMHAHISLLNVTLVCSCLLKSSI